MSKSSGRSTLMLLHIWWPLMLGASLALVVHRATMRPWNSTGVAVLLLGICTAYSLDRIFDAPHTLASWLRRTLTMSAMASTVAGGILLLRLPTPTAVVVPVVGGIALLYPAMKRLPLVKTVLVPLVWTWSAIALPFNDGSWFGWHWILQPIAAPIFLLMASGCLLCDLKDEQRDRRSGVASLPVVIGPHATTRIAIGLALAAGLIAYAEGRVGVLASAATLSVAAQWPRLLATDIVGPLVVDVILTLPGLLIVARVV